MSYFHSNTKETLCKSTTKSRREKPNMSNNIIELLDIILDNMDLIKSEDIPNIDLYMDQVTTFMDRHLGKLRRFEDDKTLTKTMINNYAKNDLLPPPIKKKYSKEHVLVLTFIYYFKNVLSINDINTVLNPITDKYFQKDGGINLETIYKEIYSSGKDMLKTMKEDVNSELELSMASFTDNEDFNSLTIEEQDKIKKFIMVSLLTFDVYIKKQLIEAIVDTMESSTGEDSSPSKK